MRPTPTEYFLRMAQLVATRSTCLRRHVGCMLVNQHKHVIATGYNGVAVGVSHCNLEVKGTIENAIGAGRLPYQSVVVEYPHACPGAVAASGTNLDGCHAIHAEQNALLQCKNVHEIVTAYVTASPCITCTKLLLNTSCQEIVFLEEYPHSAARELWEAQGRRWVHGQA